MAEQEHTQGPWKVVDENDGIVFITSPNCADYYDICDLYHHTSKGFRPKNNAEANARLISAAPELLEALQSLLVLFSEGDESGNDAFERIASEFKKDTGFLRPGKDCVLDSREVRQAEYHKWMRGKVDAATSAIAKATGK